MTQSKTDFAKCDRHVEAVDEITDKIIFSIKIIRKPPQMNNHDIHVYRQVHTPSPH